MPIRSNKRHFLQITMQADLYHQVNDVAAYADAAAADADAACAEIFRQRDSLLKIIQESPVAS